MTSEGLSVGYDDPHRNQGYTNGSLGVGTDDPNALIDIYYSSDDTDNYVFCGSAESSVSSVLL